VGRKAVLEPQGEPLDVIVPTGTRGYNISAEDFGQIVVTALKGKPPGLLEAAMSTITAELFAEAGPAPFGGGGVPPPLCSDSCGKLRPVFAFGPQGSREPC